MASVDRAGSDCDGGWGAGVLEASTSGWILNRGAPCVRRVGDRRGWGGLGAIWAVVCSDRTMVGYAMREAVGDGRTGQAEQSAGAGPVARVPEGSRLGRNTHPQAPRRPPLGLLWASSRRVGRHPLPRLLRPSISSISRLRTRWLILRPHPCSPRPSPPPSALAVLDVRRQFQIIPVTTTLLPRPPRRLRRHVGRRKIQDSARTSPHPCRQQSGPRLERQRGGAQCPQLLWLSANFTPQHV